METTTLSMLGWAGGKNKRRDKPTSAAAIYPGIWGIPKGHRQRLPILHQHEIMVVYPYPFSSTLPIVLMDNIY